MKKTEINRQLFFIQTLLQLAAERIDLIEGKQSLFTGVLKRKCKLTAEEINKALEPLINGKGEDGEEAQLQAGAMAEILEQTFDDYYKI